MLDRPKRVKRSLRLPVVLALFALAVGALALLPGELTPATAQEAPPLDQFVATLDGDPGLFNAYTSKDGKIFFEITEQHFNKDFSIITQMARGIGESFLLTGFPLGSQMVTFRLRNNRIELIARNPNFRATEGTPQGRMVERGFRESIITLLPIVAAKPKEGRYLVDVTRLFLSDPGLASVLPFVYGVGFRLDPSRSSIVSVRGFPKNVELEVDLTYAASRAFSSRALPSATSLPVALHYSVLALPEEPMKPRLADDRVGYFTTTFKDYDRQGDRTNAVRLINRWRLEKKDPYAPVSEPVKPIVFYLENTIPEEFRSYIKAGVEEWNKAFEAAGFKNAIIARDQPDDPDWDPGDVRYSTIRWVPSVDAVFAIGPSDVDPRSGEILNSDILFVSDWVRALTGEHDMLVQSPLDFLDREAEALKIATLLNPEYAQRLCSFGTGLMPRLALWRYTLMADGAIGRDGKVPEEYVGAALKETVMHEVGHALGLRHNFKASTTTPNDKLNDVQYTRRYGVSASVMDYNPPNISPDRSEQGEYYTSTVGTYDVWAIQWGYLPLRGESLARPHPQLQAIAEEHFKSDHYYGTDEDGWLYPYALDPTINQWDLGSDPITYYRDLQRLVDRLWTDLADRLVPEGGEFWPLRGAVHTLLFEQMQGYFYTVKALGGLRVTRAHKDDPMGLTPFQVLPAREQRQALQFILEAFTPEILRDFPKELLDKVPPERWWDWASSWQFGTRFTYPIHDVMTSMRVRILQMAFWPERLARIRDNAYRSDEPNPFTLDELFQGFTNTIWGDVFEGWPTLDSFQRAIQSAYLDLLITIATGEEELDSPSFSPTRVAPRVDDARALAFLELTRLYDAIGEMLDAGVQRATIRAHLLETQHRIRKALDL
jgi:hypothetical protein